MSKDTTGTPCNPSNKCTKVCGWSDAINLLQELVTNSSFATTNVSYNNCDGTTSQKAVKLEVQNTPHPDAVQKSKICQIPQTSAGITADFSGLGNIAYTNVTSLTTTTGPGGTPTAVAIPTGTREVYIKLTQGTRAIVRITLTDGSVITNQFESAYTYNSANEVHRIEADVQSLEIASANVQTIAGFINLNTAR